MRRPKRALDAGAGFDQIKPDPSQVGGVAEAPFVRLPDPAVLFAVRARRLRELAEGHVLSDYLHFLAGVTDAQAAAVQALPLPSPVPVAQVELRAEHSFPPISADQVHGNGDFAATLAWLLEHIDLGAAPKAAQAAADAVRAMPQSERLNIATGALEGAYPTGRIAEALFVVAALQVHLARLAVQLDAAAVKPPAEGVCPACGGAPVSSLVVGWTQASKARYCACSLCGTLWNHVRIKCTACGSTEGIAYYTVEDSTEAVGTIEDGPETVGPKTNSPQTISVETCTACRSYIKHMQQHEDGRLDPVADDIASYALDLLAREDDFRRASINPLFLTG